MNDPNRKSWRDSDAGRFFEKHKVLILCGAALAVGFSFGQSGGANADMQPEPVQVIGPNTDTVGPDSSVDMDEWRRKERRSDIEQKERIDTIREEQTCPNGDVISIHSTCSDS